MAVATTLMLLGIGMKGRNTPRNRQRPLKSATLSRTDLFACASSGSGPSSVQHTRTIYHHHADDRSPACRICESSYSEIHCHSREYRASGSNGWDSLLGLVVGCDGPAAGCAAHSARQASCGSASVLMSFIQHAGADAASDATLGAIWRNDCGTDDSLFARPPGNETRREHVTGCRLHAISFFQLTHF